MNPIVAALLRQQGGQQPQMGGQAPPIGGPVPGNPGAPPPQQLTMEMLNAMKAKGQVLPQDWLNQISPAERQSIMPQWSNG
jgi:hypothetical protein